jgi:Zn-dependent oligopeptidase
VQGWPTIYVLDHKGVIRFKDVRDEDMDKAVDQLLEELKAEQQKAKGTGK